MLLNKFYTLFNDLYKKIAESEEFKQAYDGKSIGEVMEIEGM